MKPATLQAVDVRKTYRGVTALAGVSLEVAAGQCLALVGESGAGKTTLLRMFNRMAEPESGIVRVAGQDVSRLDEFVLRRRMGYVPQTGGLLPHWPVLRNVALVPVLEKQPDADDAARAALELVGLSTVEYADRWPAELSGGQRQRVAIARALAAQPDCLLLDEAFSALDAITRAEVHEAFLSVRARLGVTTLMVTHDLREAALLADRIAVLRQGRIEQAGTSNAVIAAPETSYVEKLVRTSGVSA